MKNKQSVGTDTLQMLLDSIYSFVYVTEVDSYNIIFANKAFKAQFGDKVEGRKCWEVVSCGHFQDICPYCKLKKLRTLPMGEPCIWEHYNPGTKFWTHVNETITKWSDGNPVHVVVLTDISSRKNAEKELQRSQEELLLNARLTKEISDNMGNSAMYRSHINNNGEVCIDYVSSQIEKLIGAYVPNLKDFFQYFVQHIHPDDVQHFTTRILQTTGRMSSESTEFRYIKDDSIRWYKLQSVGFRQDGTIYRDGVVMDISEQKEFELELINARKKAEESEKLKTTFLANMSHEIRTPMNAIIGFTDFLLNEEDIPREEQKEYMRIVSDNANQLLKLIGDILDISKIDAGQMRIIPEETNINVLLQDVHTSFMASSVMQQGKEIELQVCKKKQDQWGMFTIDNVRVRQILNNLIGNAIKFTEKGHVKFGYSVTQEGLHFFVEDTGIGISKEKIAHLGKPFHQAHDRSLASKYGGTGIGLAISFNLIRLMNGKSWVESEPGKGSIFHFCIPCKEIALSKDIHYTEPVTAQEIPEYKLKGHTILIAEKKSTNLGYTKILLRPTEATLLFAHTGEEAVKTVEAHPEIELMIIDLNIPGMNSIEATIHIKEMRPDLPVIGETVSLTEEEKEGIIFAGFDDLIEKPVKGIELHEKINWHLK